MKFKLKKLCTFVIFLLFSVKVFSFESAKNLGFAGSGSVNAWSTGLSMEHNPAALSLNADLEFGVGYLNGELPEDFDQSGYYGFVKDSLSSFFPSRRNRRVKSAAGSPESFPFAAALSFDERKTDSSDARSYQLSLSRVWRKKISVGSSVRYTDGNGSGGALQKWSGDLGAVYKSSKRLQFGLSWINVNSSSSLEERVRFGAGFNALKLVKAFFDVEYSLEDIEDEISFGGGFEAKIKKFFAFRGGYFASGGDRPDYIGVGVSFKGPKLQVHYGAKIDADTKAALHSVDFLLPLW